jgi:DNA-binding LytR/AlgR family response regulator
MPADRTSPPQVSCQASPLATTARPTAIVADDEPTLVRALTALLGELWPELEVLATARNGLQAAEQAASLQPDFAFLDIRMPGLDGLEVAQGIEGRTRVVFVTAFDEYAVRAFEHAAVDYLLKPVTRERLQRCVDRLRAAAACPADDGSLLQVLQRLLPKTRAEPAARDGLRWVRASVGELTHLVPVEEVLFFRADDKYTCVRTATGELLIRTPIAELVQQLDPACFQQIHRSTIVNLRHVSGTRRDEGSRLFVRVRGQDAELPVSRAYVHLFKAM